MSIAARSLISPFDLHLFNEGTHSHLFDKLGAHPSHDPEGTYFAVVSLVQNIVFKIAFPEQLHCDVSTFANVVSLINIGSTA